MQALDCDFYVFSGHKLYGPTGIGVLYGKAAAIGGDAAMARRRRHDPVSHVREDRVQRAAVEVRGGHATFRRRRSGSGAAIDYVQSIGYDAIATHESELLAYAVRELSKINSSAYHRASRAGAPA